MQDTYIILEDEEKATDFSANVGKDRRDIKKSLRIEQDIVGVYVYAVVRAKFSDDNRTLEIPAQAGEPLNYEVHNLVRDCYHVEGVAYHEIGHVPVNYTVYMDDTPWEASIPLPFSIIKRYMTEQQFQEYEKWQGPYKGSNFSIQYLQVLNVF